MRKIPYLSLSLESHNWEESIPGFIRGCKDNPDQLAQSVILLTLGVDPENRLTRICLEQTGLELAH
ncbi:MAG: hypothetical protein ABSB56_09195 [Nitrososphaerales archaeon]